MPEQPTGSSPGWDPQLEALAAEAHGPVSEQTSPEPGGDERAFVLWWINFDDSAPDVATNCHGEWCAKAAWLEQARRCREREVKLRQVLERIAKLDRIDCVVTVSRLRDEARAALAGEPRKVGA